MPSLPSAILPARPGRRFCWLPIWWGSGLTCQRTVNALVSALARSAVQSLDETVGMLNPRKDTLAHVIEYVAHYAEQFFQATPIHWPRNFFVCKFGEFKLRVGFGIPC